MKPIIKIFSMLSLSSAVGEKISICGETQHIKSIGEELKKIGFDVTRKYPYTTLSKKQIKEISIVVDLIAENCASPYEIASFLIAGITDIRPFVGGRNRVLLDTVIDALSKATHLVTDASHEKVFLTYLSWSGQ